MNRLMISMLAFILAASSTIAVEVPQQKPKEIHGQGCVEPSIDARCVLIKDLKTARLYNLIIRGLQPAIGEGIEFVAVPHQGRTTCMQGAVLDVTAWARLDSLKCPHGSANRK
ncbi:MAG: hypothetical protein WAM85_15555 [Terracidiphilus sp.]